MKQHTEIRFSSLDRELQLTVKKLAANSEVLASTAAPATAMVQ